MASHSVVCVVETADIVGESLVWSAAEQALWWVDIVGRRIHRFEPESGAHAAWPIPDFPTSIGLRHAGGFVVGLARHVALWAPGGAFEPLATLEPELPQNRLNEGRVGPDGCFWVGTMQNNINVDGSPKDISRASGAIHRVHPDGRVDTLTANDIGIVNGFAWTDDGRLLTADTLRNELYAWHWDQGVGRLSHRAVFGTPFARGLPDGSCMDAQGFLWNCRVAGGGCIVRFAADGRVDRVVDLPCSWPTSCTFGGPNLTTLYVTSARFTMSAAHLDAVPQEGALFAFDAGVPGRPEHLFAG